MHHGKLLLVDDDRHVRESMSSWLQELGHQVESAGGFQEALQRFSRNKYDLVLADIRLGDGDGFDLLEEIKRQQPNQTVVLLTGYGNAETGVDALRAGAFDLLTKPLIDEELEMAIERALSQRDVMEENEHLKEQLDLRYGMDNVIGHDHRMQRIFDMINSVADTKTTVLITGESGTGKSLIARAIHRRSDRREKPFVEVACGALPETLQESELFGHVAGAFTGATGDKVGKFKQADTGTIFLDEIGTASPALQVKLLRVLQEFEFEQVGGTKTFSVDSRVVLATNENLAERVAVGTFREDLYYRINVINIELPSLRERFADIPLLAEHFLNRVREETGKQVQGFSDEAISALQRFRWPGNVRQLQNVIERAVLLGKGDVINLSDLPAELTADAPTFVVPTGGSQTLKDALAGPERQIIRDALQRHNWNRNETADALGINRTTLYKKMKRLGLEESVGA